MKNAVGAYHAKTHRAALLDRVERGERITITRHGKPVAVLVPPSGAPQMTIDDAIAALRACRWAHPADGVPVRALVEEGRRL